MNKPCTISHEYEKIEDSESNEERDKDKKDKRYEAAKSMLKKETTNILKKTNPGKITKRDLKEDDIGSISGASDTIGGRSYKIFSHLMNISSDSQIIRRKVYKFYFL